MFCVSSFFANSQTFGVQYTKEPGLFLLYNHTNHIYVVDLQKSWTDCKGIVRITNFTRIIRPGYEGTLGVKNGLCWDGNNSSKTNFTIVSHYKIES